MDGTCHTLEDLKYAYKNFAAIVEARSHGCTHKYKHKHTHTHTHTCMEVLHKSGSLGKSSGLDLEFG